jgi:hypothetical protein
MHPVPLTVKRPNGVILVLHAHTETHAGSHPRRHNRIRVAEVQDRRSDCRTPGHAGRWPPGTSRNAGRGSTETQDLCRRTSPDGSGTAEAVGSDQRNNRVAVTSRYARTLKAETQAECRWPQGNFRCHKEKVGFEESGERGTSRRQESGGEEISGERAPMKKAAKKGTTKRGAKALAAAETQPTA